MTQPTESDTRWEHGMDGWRCKSTYPRVGSQCGEVTACDAAHAVVWVVFDGEEEPVRVKWIEVRPA